MCVYKSTLKMCFESLKSSALLLLENHTRDYMLSTCACNCSPFQIRCIWRIILSYLLVDFKFVRLITRERMYIYVTTKEPKYYSNNLQVYFKHTYQNNKYCILYDIYLYRCVCVCHLPVIFHLCTWMCFCCCCCCVLPLTGKGYLLRSACESTRGTETSTNVLRYITQL